MSDMKLYASISLMTSGDSCSWPCYL